MGDGDGVLPPTPHPHLFFGLIVLTSDVRLPVYGEARHELDDRLCDYNPTCMFRDREIGECPSRNGLRTTQGTRGPGDNLSASGSERR